MLLAGRHRSRFANFSDLFITPCLNDALFIRFSISSNYIWTIINVIITLLPGGCAKVLSLVAPVLYLRAVNLLNAGWFSRFYYYYFSYPPASQPRPLTNQTARNGLREGLTTYWFLKLISKCKREKTPFNYISRYLSPGKTGQRYGPAYN